MWAFWQNMSLPSRRSFSSTKAPLGSFECLVSVSTIDSFFIWLLYTYKLPYVEIRPFGAERIIKILVASPIVMLQDGTNSLMAAASNGHLEAAQKIVAAGAALDKQNSDGHTALMFAYNGRAQVGFVLLFFALFGLDQAVVGNGHIRVVCLLLSRLSIFYNYRYYSSCSLFHRVINLLFLCVPFECSREGWTRYWGWLCMFR